MDTAIRSSTRPNRSRRVALIYDARSAYDTKVMSGVASFVQESQRWNVYIEESALIDQRLPNLKSWEGDGIIANFDHPRVAAAAVKSKLPTVAFGSGYGWYPSGSKIPYFYTNNTAIAALAADHLTSKGLRHFAFCGYPQNQINGWSSERKEAFAGALAERDFECSSYNAKPSTERRWTALQTSLGDWLQSLPKPLGVLAANDNRGRHILEACRQCGLKVPEHVAVLGVDNDELLCRLSSPLLSSVEQGAKRLGYEAARLLDLMMKGEPVPTNRVVIDPFGVITRASSDVLAIEDLQVSRAMEYISKRYAQGISVQDVVKSTSLSRSGLEKKFRALLGDTIASKIRKLQMEKARELVLTSNRPLKEIASSLGFPTVQHMTTLFRHSFGVPPGQLRQMMSPGSTQLHK